MKLSRHACISLPATNYAGHAQKTDGVDVASDRSIDLASGVLDGARGLEER